VKIFTQTMLFAKRKLIENLRQPAWVISDLTVPLLYIFLFAPLLRNMGGQTQTMAEVLNSFVPGILTVLAFATASGSGWAIIRELNDGVIERFRVTPASRFSILAGSITADIAAFVVPAIIVIALSSFFGFTVNILGLTVLLLLLCLLVAVISAWSGSLGLIMKQESSLAAIVVSSQLPLTLLSGALLPMSLAPDWMRVIAHANPFFYAVEASRVLAAGVLISYETVLAFAVMVPLTALTLWWATGVYRRAVA
jgi:ABC-2 type transport system permease protein